MLIINLQKENNLQKRSFFSLHISKVITTNCLELELCLHNKELRDVCLPYNWTPDSIINLGQTLVKYCKHQNEKLNLNKNNVTMPL